VTRVGLCLFSIPFYFVIASQLFLMEMKSLCGNILFQVQSLEQTFETSIDTFPSYMLFIFVSVMSLA